MLQMKIGDTTVKGKNGHNESRVTSRGTVDTSLYKHIKILMFHRVVDDKTIADKHWFCLHSEKFRGVLEQLDRWGFVPITFDDYRMFCVGELSLPKKPVILTFDDGYRDSYEIVLPLLNEYGMKAVFFVLGDRSIRSNIWDRRFEDVRTNLLTGDQILELSESGMEIGAHSMSHMNLTLIGEKEAWYEISRSRVLLEILLNRPVKTFSYPFGFVNKGVKKLALNAGYTHACSVWSGPLRFGKDNFELRRIIIQNTTNEAELAFKLSNSFLYYSWLRWKIRKIGHIDYAAVPPTPQLTIPLARKKREKFVQ